MASKVNYPIWILIADWNRCRRQQSPPGDL